MDFKLSDQENDRAKRIHNESIVIDTLNQGPAVWTDKIFNRVNAMIQSGTSAPFWELSKLATDELLENPEARRKFIDDVRSSGVTAISNTISTSLGDDPISLEGAVRDIVALDHLISNLDEILVKATSAEDIRRAKKEKKMAIIYNFQNTTHLGYNLDNIDFFHNMGVSVIQLTYNMMNLVGVGTTEKYEETAGLSYFGRNFVERLNKLGILVDTGHCGAKTTLDAIEASKAPVVCTHTACRSVYNYPRAKSDEVIKAVADSGGYIGMYAVPFFYPEKDRTINHLLDEIDHAVEVAGVNHVGVGLDYGGQSGPWPEQIGEALNEAMKSRWADVGFRKEHGVDPRMATKGIEVFSKWPNVTRGLVSRGYSDREIRNILGENFLRVFEKVVG